MDTVKERKIIKPSKYSERIFSEVITTGNHIAVSAAPGSGKTTNLVEIAKLLPYGKKSIFVAFNRHIVKELKERLPQTTTASTMHSLGAKAIGAHYQNGWFLSEGKQIKYLLPYFENKTNREKWPIIYQLDRVMQLMRATMTPLTREGIEKLVEKYALDLDEEHYSIAIKALRDLYAYNDQDWNSKMECDFTDLIEHCVRHKDIQMPQHDYVMIDEAADMSTLDRKFINKLVKPIRGRKILVGDKNQCQPAGTKILMYDGSEKNIEDIEIGDSVVSYELHTTCCFLGFYKNHRWGANSMKKYAPFVKKIAKNKNNKDLIVIESFNKISKYTFNHRCLARFNPNKLKAHVVYLMQKGDWFRIGITPLWGSHNNSVTYRAKGERADKFWIIEIYEERQDAYLKEQYYSVLYGIPQMMFFDNGCVKMGQQRLDDFHNSFDKEEMKRRSEQLLNDHNKSIEYPFWEKRGANYKSKLHLFEIRACNLFAEYMQMNHFDEFAERNKKYQRIGRTYKNIDKIWTEKYEEYVYSLEISKCQTYVADGILTHNSIYSFKGTDIDSFQQFAKEERTTTLPLSISYRCSKAVVKAAQRIYPDGIEVWDQAEEGIERIGKVEEIKENDFVLCRNTRPLIDVFFQLIEAGKKASIVGRDSEKGLLKLLSQFQSHEETINCFERLKNALSAYYDLAKSKGIAKPKNNAKYIIMEEKIAILSLLFSKFTTIKEVEDFISEIFSDEEREGVKLMTIHKSKGLECNTVFVIDKYKGMELIPSQYAVTADQLKQEKNLQFVSITRAKKELVYLHL